MNHFGKCCNSDTKSNKNLKITLEAHTYRYDSSKSIYSCVGKTGLLTASHTLIACISNKPSFHINDGSVTFNHEEMSELEGYLPFYEEVNIDERIMEITATETTSTKVETTDEVESDSVSRTVNYI